MTRSTLIVSLGFAFALAFAATTIGCSDSGGGGMGGTTGTAGTTGRGGTTGSAGTTGSGGGGTTGTAGTTGSGGGGSNGTAGTTGNGGRGGTTGSGGGGSNGTAGTTGNGGRGGTTGTAGTTGNGGRGGTTGNAGTTGNGGRGGTTGIAGTTGNGGRGGTTGTGGSGGSAALTLTSTAFTNGMMIPAAQTCTGMSHMSPPLTWTAGPSGTMSYGIALVDMSNGFVHWTIWDIPAATMSLPGALPTTQVLTTPVMAKQVNRFAGDGYFGPCPGGQTHTYVFEVYALDVATLPTLSATSMTDDVRTQMMAHDLASGTLSGTSNASM